MRSRCDIDSVRAEAQVNSHRAIGQRALDIDRIGNAGAVDGNVADRGRIEQALFTIEVHEEAAALGVDRKVIVWAKLGREKDFQIVVTGKSSVVPYRGKQEVLF